MQPRKLPKILHLSTPLSWRGGEQQLWWLYQSLQQKGIPQLIACPKNSKLAQTCKEQQADCMLIKPQGGISITNAWQVKSICTHHEIDIVHAHDAHALTTAILANLVFNNKAIIVGSRRVNYPIKGLFSRLKYNNKHLQKIICVSYAVARVIMPAIKDTHKITTVHSGIDLSKFKNHKLTTSIRKEYDISSDTLLIGNAAALTEQKDYPTFIRTAKILIDQGLKIKFIIIGDGHLRDALQQQVDDLDLSQHVIFTGFRSDIAILLPELDVLLSTSINEGLGTTVLEAMMAGVPVVATAAGGIDEMISHGKTGMLVKQHAADQLANCINEILADDMLRQRLITQAKIKVSQFDKLLTAEKTLAVYQEIYNQ